MRGGTRVKHLETSAWTHCSCCLPVAAAPPLLLPHCLLLWLLLPPATHGCPLPPPPNCLQEVAPHMMRQRGGLIVMIGSVTAHMASPFAGAYSASKAALLGLTDSLRLELQPFGVQVSYVTAGSIK